MLTDTVCAALSAAGLGIAVMTAFRRRFLAATRLAAYALLPVGLAMTGILRWVTDLVFKPTVWIGFGVLAVSWLLFMITRAVEHRSGGGSRPERRAEPAAQQPAAAAAPQPSELGPARSAAPGAKKRGNKAAGGATGSDDFSDIEAILKKHGI